jgi:excisionase family DNA binding protein
MIGQREEGIMAAKRKKKGAKRAARRAGKAADAAPAAGGRAGGGELLGMDEAIELLKTTRPTFYRWLRAGKIKGMKVGRQWRFYRSEIDRFLKGEAPRVDPPVSIEPLIAELAERAREMGVEGLAAPETGNVGNAVDLIINLGAALKASDIHIEPFSTRPGAETIGMIRYRIDGVLHPAVEFDLRLMPALVERFKAEAACDVRERMKPQDGRILLKAGEKTLDLRVCFVGTAMGEGVTVRILDSSNVMLSLERIDYAPGDRERLIKNLRSPWGLILCTGPTGSGKTTVLYSCLNQLCGPGVKTMSLEDPVEFLLPWVTQIAVDPSRGLTFEKGARAILRSDPDVIMIGEIRNRETLTVCQQAALTGHLVMTTLHTDEAASALKRMMEIGSEPFVVAESTRLILAQRLVRKLCPECSKPQGPSDGVLKHAAELARSGGLGWETLEPRFRGPTGCAACGKTGFRGRTVMAEVLEVTGEIGAAVRRGAAVEEIRAIAVGQGMTTMAADGIRRAAAGQVVLGEVLQVLGLR